MTGNSVFRVDSGGSKWFFRWRYRFFACSLLLLNLAINVEGGGILQVKLISFTNPGGKGSNGQCCDGKWGFCEGGGGCDHYFIVCADAYNRSIDMSSCLLGKQTTDTVHNQATINFGARIGARTVNPMSFNFNSWQGVGVRIKIHIWDEDGNSHDEVEFLKKDIEMTLARSAANATWMRTMIRDRTTMVLEVRAYCADKYYGDSCSVYCDARQPRGHVARCDESGRKICATGWSGVNCDQLNECAREPCQNGATCHRLTVGYTCDCPPGWVGRLCEIEEDECQAVDCHNGTCEDRFNDFSCECSPGYTGKFCDQVDHCDEEPCLNSGSCENTQDGFNCSCSEEWSGERCESRIDECSSSSSSSNPCGDNSDHCESTVDGIICSCLPGWTGSKCEDEIKTSGCWSSEDLCQNGGTCVPLELEEGEDAASIRCNCPPGFTGSDCGTLDGEVDFDKHWTSAEGDQQGTTHETEKQKGSEETDKKETSDEDVKHGTSDVNDKHGTSDVNDKHGTSDVNDKHGSKEEEFTTWTFYGHLGGDDLSALRDYLVKMTAGADSQTPVDQDNSDWPQPSNDREEIDVECRVQNCTQGPDKAATTVFSFRLRRNQTMIRRSEVQRILNHPGLPGDALQFPLFDRLISTDSSCAHASEFAHQASEKQGHHIAILCVAIFLVVIVAVVAAAVIIKKRRDRAKPVMEVSNPIYSSDEGTEEQDGQGAVRLTLDRESQKVTSALFTFPNEYSSEAVPGSA